MLVCRRTPRGLLGVHMDHTNCGDPTVTQLTRNCAAPMHLRSGEGAGEDEGKG